MTRANGEGLLEGHLPSNCGAGAPSSELHSSRFTLNIDLEVWCFGKTEICYFVQKWLILPGLLISKYCYGMLGIPMCEASYCPVCAWRKPPNSIISFRGQKQLACFSFVKILSTTLPNHVIQ